MLKRMWINQPSTLQPHHDLHGTNVLAYEECPGTHRVYFLTRNAVAGRDVIDQQMFSQYLSPGWLDDGAIAARP